MAKYLDSKQLPSPLPLWPVPWYLRWRGIWRFKQSGKWVYLTRAEYARLFRRQ